MQVFVSGTCILESNRWWISVSFGCVPDGPGFRIPQAKVSQIPDSTDKLEGSNCRLSGKIHFVGSQLKFAIFVGCR